MLLTVIASIPFVAGLGIAALTLLATVGGNFDRIRAALRGDLPTPVVMTRPVKVRFSQRPVRVQPMRAQPRWRVAA